MNNFIWPQQQFQGKWEEAKLQSLPTLGNSYLTNSKKNTVQVRRAIFIFDFITLHCLFNYKCDIHISTEINILYIVSLLFHDHKLQYDNHIIVLISNHFLLFKIIVLTVNYGTMAILFELKHNSNGSYCLAIHLIISLGRHIVTRSVY